MIQRLIDATWPAAGYATVGPWLIRDGRGGGSRVSAATLTLPTATPDIDLAEHEMARLGQPPLFMIHQPDCTLDALLAERGYVAKDPVLAHGATILALTGATDARAVIETWPPLAAQATLWAAGGIGPERLAIMHRVTGPRTSLLIRSDDRPAGCGFVACHGRQAMLHALEVSAAFRRRGMGRDLVRAAAHWAGRHGASDLMLLAAQANTGATALYAGLGMAIVGRYHYRTRP